MNREIDDPAESENVDVSLAEFSDEITEHALEFVHTSRRFAFDDVSSEAIDVAILMGIHRAMTTWAFTHAPDPLSALRVILIALIQACDETEPTEARALWPVSSTVH